MTQEKLLQTIACGETSTTQFKREFSSPKQIAAEIAAFANTKGGSILFGIEDKTGKVIGLDYGEIQSISSAIGNAATELVKPSVFLTTEVVCIAKKKILVATIPEGKNKPYKDTNGIIWVKQAADKRKLTENNEILELFQESGDFAPESAAVPNTSIQDIETAYLNEFFQKAYGKDKENFGIPLSKLLQSISILAPSGELTRTGLLFFGRLPQLFFPAFMIKAVAFYENDIGSSHYADSRNIQGTIPWMFREALAFLKANLFHRQNGRNFNTVGELEIPEVVLEELLQNALVHIDLLQPASIRLLVFPNRIEIINPGCLVGSLTVDDIKLGISKLRNPLIASLCSKLMIYRGLGSGIIRALRENVSIDFVNNPSAKEFKVVIWRSAQDNRQIIDNQKVSDNKAIYTATSSQTQRPPQQSQIQSQKTYRLSSKEKIIYDYVLNNPYAKTSDIALCANLSQPQTRVYLQRLVKASLIIASGANKNRTYSAA